VTACLHFYSTDKRKQNTDTETSTAFVRIVHLLLCFQNSLLVKAWETHVFPAIRRRFRNETERRDGLEQIKGALSLGMLDIARQTVEFLYEENGGIPRDLKVSFE
jgi:hypothetical protein